MHRSDYRVLFESVLDAETKNKFKKESAGQSFKSSMDSGKRRVPVLIFLSHSETEGPGLVFACEV